MFRDNRRWIAFVSCVSLLGSTITPSFVLADPPAKRQRPKRAEFVSYDVQLGAKGTFSGKLTDAAGKSLVHAPVVLYQGRQAVNSTRTDKRGRFEFDKLRGGVYQLYTVDRQGMVRAWAPGSAPPGTTDSLLVVSGYRAVRGQYDLSDVLRSGVIPIVAVTAAAVAIPIVVSDNKKSGS